MPLDYTSRDIVSSELLCEWRVELHAWVKSKSSPFAHTSRTATQERALGRWNQDELSFWVLDKLKDLRCLLAGQADNTIYSIIPAIVASSYYEYSSSIILRHLIETSNHLLWLEKLANFAFLTFLTRYSFSTFSAYYGNCRCRHKVFLARGEGI